MSFWLLALSYWIHLLATVVWFSGLALMGLLAWPALQAGSLPHNQWLRWQKRFLPWVNGSLLLLLITGFIQMTNDSNYGGFLVLDGVWAWAMLLKHIAFGLLVGTTAVLQFSLYPALERARLLAEKRPALAAAERQKQQRQEKRLLQVNAVCAAVILLCTAVATAV